MHNMSRSWARRNIRCFCVFPQKIIAKHGSLNWKKKHQKTIGPDSWLKIIAPITIVRSGQNHQHRIAARKNTSASHRHQKLTIAEVYSHHMYQFLFGQCPNRGCKFFGWASLREFHLEMALMVTLSICQICIMPRHQKMLQNQVGTYSLKNHECLHYDPPPKGDMT